MVKKHRSDGFFLGRLALLMLMIVQICLIAYSNIALIEKNLDCDAAKLFYHIAEIWKQKKLLLPDWSYMTTLEWDCSSILALPFYIGTNNIVLSFGLANIVFLFGFIYIIFFLFRGKDSLYPLLCSNLIIVPYQMGMLDYYNMLFFGGGQYIIKTVLPLFLIGLILFIDKSGRAEQKLPLSAWISMGIFLILLMISSMSSGVYVAVCGIFPIVTVYMVYMFFRWEKISNSFIILLAGSAGAVLSGWYVNNIVMSGGARGNSMVLCSVNQMLDNVSSCFFGMFELFGGMTQNAETRVLSFWGMVQLAKFCMVLLMLISAVLAVKKCICKRCDLRILLLLSVFLWNLFILIVSNTRSGASTFEYRYHLVGMLPLMCVTGIFLLESMQGLSAKQQWIVNVAGYLGIVFICVGSYRALYSQPDKTAELKELCMYVRDFDVEHVYIYNNSSDTEICRVLDENTSYICLIENGITLSYDYYSRYAMAPMQTENVVVVVDDRIHNFGDTFEIGGYNLRKFDAVGNKSLYYFLE